MQKQETVSRWVTRWLVLVAAMIFSTLVVGGATRLTKSGLSITEWQPILGAIPPFNDADWQEAFAKYQQSFQYKLMNQGMALSDFKTIFWWEWAHRFLDRLIGTVFALPLIFFVVTGSIKRSMWPRLLLVLIAGGLEGVVGWYMVASGLNGRVSVSPYYLAAHLTLATTVFAAVVWTIFSFRRDHARPMGTQCWLAVLLPMMVVLQIAAGGFVAGLDAGQGYNTWPLMDGTMVPQGLAAMQPAWRNIFENAMTVQFDHRILAYLLLMLAVMHAITSRRISSALLAGAVLLQASMGILTLLYHVPIGLALIHQAGALLVLTAALWNVHEWLKVNIASLY